MSDGGVLSYKRLRRPKLFRCDYKSQTLRCSFTCTYYAAMSIHIELTHCCSACGGSFDSLLHHRPHCSQHGRGRQPTQQPTGNIDIRPFIEIRHSLKGTLLVYSAPVQPADECQVAAVFENLYFPLRKLLEALVAHFSGVKVSFRLIADLIEVTHGVEHIRDVIGSPFMTLSHKKFIPRVVNSSCIYLVNSLNLYLSTGSNWQLTKLHELQLYVGQWTPIKGRAYVPIPRDLAGRRGLLSIQSNSNCFALSMLCSLFEEEVLEAGRAKRRRLGKSEQRQNSKVERSILENPASYEHFLDRLDLSILPSPDVELLDIDLVEKRLEDTSITVYGNKGKDIILLRAPIQARDRQVNLLLVKHDDRDEYHYICIRSISQLLGKHNEFRHEYCAICQKRFDARYWTALTHTCQETAIRVPVNKSVRFRRFDALLEAPFLLFYKFSFLSVDPAGEDRGGARYAQENVPIGFSLFTVGDGDVERHTYIGEDCVDIFFETAMTQAKSCVDLIKFTNKFIPPTLEELRLHEEATTCTTCGKAFNHTDVLKAYHHCHFRGIKLQTCCLVCNQQIRPTNYITAVTLGGKNEFKYLREKIKSSHGVVTPIKQKSGTIIGLELRQTIQKSDYDFHFGVKFTDMGNFRPDSSLISLVSELKSFNGASSYPVFEDFFGKNALPETYLSVDEDTFPTLSTAQDFFSKKSTPLNQFFPSIKDQFPAILTSLSIEDFIRHSMNAKAALISDTFEATRQQYWKEFSLDLASFWGVPAFSREAALYMEKCELEPVRDPEIAERIDRAIFGAFVQTTRLKSVANSELFTDFDPTRPPVQILSVDQISCYSKPLMGNLPHREFRVMSRQELDEFQFDKADWDNFGWIFEVDLDYSSEAIKDWISDFPYPQERMRLNITALSSTQLETFVQAEKTFVECERVLQTLYPKKRQVYYGKLLKWIIDHGGVITNVYFGAQFREAPIFAKFSTNNVIARNEAKSELEKQTRKLLNNSLYGQMLKQAADYPISKIVGTSIQAKRELSKDTFQGFEILDENTAEFELKKSMVTDVNIRAVGLAILSHAKVNLLSHLYDGLKAQFGTRCHHVFTHTDSIVAEIHCTRDEYVDGLRAIGHRFDFSNLDPNHPLHCKSRKGIPGLLQIQSEGIKEFYSTSGTQYSMLYDPAFEQPGRLIKAGGIAKKQASKLRHEDFKRIVEDGDVAAKIKVTTVRIVDGKMLSLEANHSSLSGINVYRFFHSNVLSFPYGDRRIQDIGKM